MKPKSQSIDDFQRFANASEWESWLATHQAETGGVWLLIAKKGYRGPGLSISDALDVALCFGWIDSHRKGYDETHYLQRYSPRRPKSPWSKLNVQRTEALIAEGRMQEGGFKEIKLAKSDGRWAVAYESQSEAAIPDDVVSALAANPLAAKAFEALSKSARYSLILPVLKATTPQVRSRRVQKLVSTLVG
jgi:uncharacterized protein YdeI (YjbR/CyaY-like superfamily)